MFHSRSLIPVGVIAAIVGLTALAGAHSAWPPPAPFESIWCTPPPPCTTPRCRPPKVTWQTGFIGSHGARRCRDRYGACCC